MAKLALALLAAPAVAFNFGGGGGAPARAAVDTTADIGVDPGPIEPTGPFWEDQEGLARRRAVEIKHGRIAMMAFIGMIVEELGVTFPGSINLDGSGQLADILKGCFVVTSSPMFGIMLLISCINQLARRCGFSFTKPLGEDRAYWVTDAVHKLLARMGAWAWTTVLLYAIYWGMAYISVQVLVSRFTILFLSWLISTCEGMHIFIVTGIIWAVGLFLFLLPPVPGVPIYLTGGILLVASGKEYLGGKVEKVRKRACACACPPPPLTTPPFSTSYPLVGDAGAPARAQGPARFVRAHVQVPR